jgi:hypothetical protein
VLLVLDAQELQTIGSAIAVVFDEMGLIQYDPGPADRSQSFGMLF